MATPVTAEAIFDHHAIALGLPARKDRTLGGYVKDFGETDEAERCITEAVDAAALADHVGVAHWLQQARQHMPSRKK